MRIKSSKVVGLVVLGMGAAQAARGEDAKVSTGAEAAKLGAEFRAELNRNDHGFQKVDGAKSPSATTTLGVQTMKVKLSGKLNKDTDFAFRFNLFDPDATKGPVDGSPLDYGYGTHWFTEMFGMSMGKAKVMQGGWDTIDDSFRDHWSGAYKDHLAFYKYDNMIALHLKVAGQLNLQVLNDKTKDGTDANFAGKKNGKTQGEWGKTQHPTFALGWLGKFGAISPIVDLGFYDQQKSRWADVGVKAEMDGLTARFDLRNTSVSNAVPDSSGKDKSKEDVETAYTLYVGYEVPGVVTPFVYYSAYDNKQYADSATGKKDWKGNSAAAPTDSPNFDDNKQVMSIGANVGVLGKGWTPYLAYTQVSGKFYKGAASDATETKSEGQVHLGILGEF